VKNIPKKEALLFFYENILKQPYENVLFVGTTTSGVWRKSSTSTLYLRLSSGGDSLNPRLILTAKSLLSHL